MLGAIACDIIGSAAADGILSVCRRHTKDYSSLLTVSK